MTSASTPHPKPDRSLVADGVMIASPYERVIKIKAIQEKIKQRQTSAWQDVVDFEQTEKTKPNYKPMKFKCHTGCQEDLDWFKKGLHLCAQQGLIETVHKNVECVASSENIRLYSLEQWGKSGHEGSSGFTTALEMRDAIEQVFVELPAELWDEASLKRLISMGYLRLPTELRVKNQACLNGWANSHYRTIYQLNQDIDTKTDPKLKGCLSHFLPRMFSEANQLGLKKEKLEHWFNEVYIPTEKDTLWIETVLPRLLDRPDIQNQSTPFVEKINRVVKNMERRLLLQTAQTIHSSTSQPTVKNMKIL